MPNPFLQDLDGRQNPILEGDLSLLGRNYVPDNFPHREGQIDHLVSLLKSVTRNINPSNILIYGRTGSGKTSCVIHVTSMLAEAMPGRVIIKHINCQVYDSIYSILVSLVNSLSDNESQNIPVSGWTIDRIYSELIGRLSAKQSFLLIVLDEIDKLIQKGGSDSVYVLLKIADDLKEKGSSIIGITNYIGFLDSLDSRVQSRLSQETVMFPPYNANELKDILEFRIKGILKPDAINEGTIALCAAIGAQEHGDARKALDLLKLAVEIAIRNGRSKVGEEEIIQAKETLEVNVLKETIRGLPLHSKFVLLSAILSEELTKRPSFTGEIYSNYCRIASEVGYSPLTPRRVGDIISDLDEYGLITTKIASMGRHGRTRYIEANEKREEMKNYILEEEIFSGFRGKNIGKQTRFEEDWLGGEKDRLQNVMETTMDPDSIQEREDKRE